MLIPGFATPEGTERFVRQFSARLPGYSRQTHGLWLSSIGLGTYLGEPDGACDARYREAVTLAVKLGINVFDSAINYRHQRSERSVGQALAALISAGLLRRDEVFLATKGGFLSFDGSEPADPSAYFHERFVESGIIRAEDVAAGCHVMSPAYLADQIESSRRNLGVETLDLYYVHNPETQLSALAGRDFYLRLAGAFETLERAVTEGKIRYYGVATWNAFRVEPDAPDALSLAQVLDAAKQAAGQNHHFRAVQLPFNLAMPEAFLSGTQSFDGKRVALLRAAAALDLMAFASASLLQGQLTGGLPEEVARKFGLLKTDAQRALQFVRSAPGITAALVGMSRVGHVEENLGTATVPPLDPAQYRALFK